MTLISYYRRFYVFNTYIEIYDHSHLIAHSVWCEAEFEIIIYLFYIWSQSFSYTFCEKDSSLTWHVCQSLLDHLGVNWLVSSAIFTWSHFPYTHWCLLSFTISLLFLQLLSSSLTLLYSSLFYSILDSASPQDLLGLCLQIQ